MIDPNEIHIGDRVGLVDPGSNMVRGEVRAASGVSTDLLCIDAFGTVIPFARLNKMGRMVPLPVVRIVEHQPQLGAL